MRQSVLVSVVRLGHPCSRAGKTIRRSIRARRRRGRNSEFAALILGPTQRGSEMALSCTRQRIRASERRVDKLQIVSRLSFGVAFMFLLFSTARSDAADSCLDNLPAPTPLLHKVVQLVNCSKQRVLGAANAAHIAGLAPTPVLPREKTWVMEPFPVPSGAPANSNVLTIH